MAPRHFGSVHLILIFKFSSYELYGRHRSETKPRITCSGLRAAILSISEPAPEITDDFDFGYIVG